MKLSLPHIPTPQTICAAYLALRHVLTGSGTENHISPICISLKEPCRALFSQKALDKNTWWINTLEYPILWCWLSPAPGSLHMPFSVLKHSPLSSHPYPRHTTPPVRGPSRPLDLRAHWVQPGDMLPVCLLLFILSSTIKAPRGQASCLSGSWSSPTTQHPARHIGNTLRAFVNE